MYPLFFFLLGSLSTEYNVTVMLSFKGDEWYIYKYSFLFFLVSLKSGMYKKYKLYRRLQYYFFFLLLYKVLLLCVCMVCCTVRSILKLMHAVFEKKQCVCDDDDDDDSFFFFHVRSFNCLTLLFCV
jgi:hypothetical protein